jgi:hypothetical protein
MLATGTNLLTDIEHSFYARCVFGGSLHTAGPDDRCIACGEPFPCPTGLSTYAHIRPRQLEPNPRCAACNSGGMFHPMHQWWTCDVRLSSGDLCGCTVTDQPLTL